jgi:DNA polymerase
LRRQIEIIDPLVIATLGRYSMNMFFPNARISLIHGQPKYGTVRAYYPFFHPAAVLRDSDLRPLMEADFARLLDVVAEVTRRRATGEMGDAPNEDAAMNIDAPPDSDEESPKQMGLFD